MKASPTLRRLWLASALLLTLSGLLPFVLIANIDGYNLHQLALLPISGLHPHPPSTDAAKSRRQKKVITYNESEDVHIVFSTDCSGYQHWQGIALVYAAQVARHRGPITRIASGCDSEQQYAISSEWRKIDNGRGIFRVHFTPSNALNGGNYKYSNKPGGLRHWLNHAQPNIQESYVLLIDPDMLPLLPITPRLGQGLDTSNQVHRHKTKQIEYIDRTSGMARILRQDEPRLLDLIDRVQRGYPAGQHFGVGGTWARAETDKAKPNWVNFSKAFVCGDKSPCTTTTAADADYKYAVGPVYLAHVDDWRRIAVAWWEAMPRVHQQHPHLLAEMFAMCMGTANLTLPWTLLSNYMVSDPGTNSPTEAWSWIDDIAKDNSTAVCTGASSAALPYATRGNKNSISLPTTLHYCERYKFAGHLFAKRKVPHDFFRCDGQYLAFDVHPILQELSSIDPPPSKVQIRSAFMICHLIPMMNQALDSYKRDVCVSTIAE